MLFGESVRHTRDSMIVAEALLAPDIWACAQRTSASAGSATVNSLIDPQAYDRLVPRITPRVILAMS